MSAKSVTEIASLLKAVKFKKKLMGGVDEDDVWRLLEQLQAEYCSLVDAAEQRVGGLLDERNEIIRRQQKEITQLKERLGGDADG